MGDLISRSALLKEIETWGGDIESLREYISNMPTAYDIDKIVVKLAERSKEYNSGLRLHGKPEEMITNEAIEIVKNN